MDWRRLASLFLAAVLLSIPGGHIHSARRPPAEAPAPASSKSWLPPAQADRNGSANLVNLLVKLHPNTDRMPIRAFLRQAGSRIAYEYRLLPGVIAVRGVPAHALEQLQAHSAVKWIQPDRVRHAALVESVPLIDADAGSMAGLSDGTGVTACVLDTGVNKTHPAFTGALVAEYDFVNGDADASDDEGHGTHVASIILSRDATYAGVAPGASLAVGKVLDDMGSGYDSDIIAGIEWCTLTVGASVINMSLGDGAWPGSCDFDTLATAVNTSVDQGVVHVIASGNEAELHSIGSPGCASRAITVGAVYDDALGSRTWCIDPGCSQILCSDSSIQADDVVCFSNGSPKLTVVAPGSEIDSADAFSSGFVLKSSTSMAAPHVAGLVARLLGENPGLTPADTARLLARNAIDLEAPGFDDRAGHGRIDALATLSDNTPLTCTVPLDCDDGDPCTVEACENGFCAHLPACDDGDACTVDECTAGSCSHLAASLDDGLSCTTDSCDACLGPTHHVGGANCNTSCTAALPISVGMTVTGQIDSGTPSTYNTTCPGFSTTGRDLAYRIHLKPEQAVDIRVTPTSSWDPAVYVLMAQGPSDCDLSRCVGGMDVSLAGDSEEMARVRVPVEGDYYIVVDTFYADDTGSFQLAVSAACDPEEDGRPCDDGNACTVADTCTAGICAGVGAPGCDDGDPCTLDHFDGAQCQNPPAPGGTICSDGHPCSVEDQCDGAGNCTGVDACVFPCGGIAEVPCPAGAACLDLPDDGCDPACGGSDCGGMCVSDLGLPCLSSVGCSSGLVCADNPTDTCLPGCGGSGCEGTCVAVAGLCGGITSIECPAGFTCIDEPADGCDPQCGGSDCGGVCVPDLGFPCQSGLPCPSGLTCVDDPGDDCSPACGGADCDGTCAAPAGLCGGSTGIKCPAGFTCVDDPADGCDPQCGGVDCGGICLEADSVSSSCGGVAGLPCPGDLICVDDPTDTCEPACGGTDCGGICVRPCGPPDPVRTLGLEDPNHILWEPLACVDTYNLYRLSAPSLEDADLDGLADSYGTCYAFGLLVPEALDPSMPPAGWAYYYLATGTSLLGEGTLGFNSASQERPNLLPCP